LAEFYSTCFRINGFLAEIYNFTLTFKIVLFKQGT